MNKFGEYLNYIAATIIGITVIGVLILSFVFLTKKDNKIETIKIEYHGIKTDSINELNKLEIVKIDSLLQSIQKTSNNIQQKQLELVEQKESDLFFNKLYTAIIAIILAIAGFFGFKSVSEIKERAINDAKSEAKFVADKEFEKVFDDNYKSAVAQEAAKAVSDVLRTEIKSLEDRLYKLENNLPEMNNDDTDINEDEPENPFENE